jgi:fatty acid-binding protein DegV
MEFSLSQIRSYCDGFSCPKSRLLRVVPNLSFMAQGGRVKNIPAVAGASR